MGIRAKLLLCLLSVLVPLIVTSGFSIHLFDQQLTERVEMTLLNDQRLEAARINNILADYRQDASSLADSDHIKRFLGELHAIEQGYLPKNHVIGGVDGFEAVNPVARHPLHELATRLILKAGTQVSEIVELRIINLDGKVLGQTDGYSWVPTDTSLIQGVIETSRTTFGDAFLSGDEARLGLVTPIKAMDGQIVGSLLLETRLGPVVDLVSEHQGVGYSSEGHIAQATIDGDAQFLTPLRFDRNAAFEKIVPDSIGLPINHSLKAPVAKIIHANDYRGVESILAIGTIPETGWGLVVKLDAEEAFLPVNKLRRSMTLAAMLSIAVVLAGYLLYLHPLAKRLRRNATAAQLIMGGDLTTRIGDKAGDEIGDAARSIDRLANDLQADQKKRIVIEDRLRHQALHDDLTGLYNRKHANSIIRSLSTDSVTTDSVMFLDLDGFKSVNDQYGHGIGDDVLVIVAQRLTSMIPDSATLARWGGDEFVIILPDTENQAAADMATHIHRAFEVPVKTDAGKHVIACSIGLATSTDGRGLNDVLTDADTLMYEQKKMRQTRHGSMSMASKAVDRALLENRIELWYQPIVTVDASGQIKLRGAEALVRLRTKDGAIVLPNDFLGGIRKQPLGHELDKYVIDSTLQSVSRWRDAGMVDSDFTVSLNLTGETLRNPSCVSLLTDALNDNCLARQQLIIEISEDTESLDPQLISQLKATGIKVALDDVGLHHSNLDRLINLAPDSAKIDRRWMSDNIVLPRLVGICQQMDIEVVAEGVEKSEQLDMLKSLSVTMFQGYLFDKPAPAIQFISRWGSTPIAELENTPATKSRDLKLVV